MPEFTKHREQLLTLYLLSHMSGYIPLIQYALNEIKPDNSGF